MDKTEVLDQLVQMSLNLAKPENEFVILGEGNTSGRVDDDTFYVKQSGAYLSQSTRDSFVQVRSDAALAILEEGHLTDDDIKNRLTAARVDSFSSARPSIETVFHAFLLSLPGINFVGHTHPMAVNSILCSKRAKEIVSGRIFPDEIVYCGIEPIFIEYSDPGPTLAKSIRTASLEFMDKQGIPPKVILMQNHGFIGLGATPHEVEAITHMWVKTCKVLAGTYIFGGPRYFTKENVERIYTRPDEAYRKRQFKE